MQLVLHNGKTRAQCRDSRGGKKAVVGRNDDASVKFFLLIAALAQNACCAFGNKMEKDPDIRHDFTCTVNIR